MKRFNHIIQLFEAYIYYVYINRRNTYVFYMSKNEILGPN